MCGGGYYKILNIRDATNYYFIYLFSFEEFCTTFGVFPKKTSPAYDRPILTLHLSPLKERKYFIVAVVSSIVEN